MERKDHSTKQYLEEIINQLSVYVVVRGVFLTMLFEIDSLVVYLFPLLVIVPAATSFITILTIRRHMLRAESYHWPIAFIHVMRAIELAFLLPLLGVIMTGIINFVSHYVLHVEVATPRLYFFQLILETVVSALIEITTGILLAVVYSVRGVSGFIVTTTLICVPHLVAVSLGSIGLVLEHTMDNLYYIIIPVLFFFEINHNGFLAQIFRIRIPSENEISNKTR